MINIKQIISAITLITILSTITSCNLNSPKRYNEGSAVVYCDEGFKNILEEEIEVFEYRNPKASILPMYVSENEAINKLLEDSTDSVIVTQELSPENIEYIKSQRRPYRTEPIAVDAVALIVNNNNPINELSVGEIRDILIGKTSTWRQLAWNDTNHIKIVFDNPGSSTVNYMKNNILKKGDEFSKYTFAQKSNADVFKIVEQNPYAIGIISVSWLGEYLETLSSTAIEEKSKRMEDNSEVIAVDFTDNVKVLRVRYDDQLDGVKPYQVYINTGEYPLYRKVYMISTAESASLNQHFYTFITGFIGQKIISMTGIMPYRVHQRIIELN